MKDANYGKKLKENRLNFLKTKTKNQMVTKSSLNFLSNLKHLCDFKIYKSNVFAYSILAHKFSTIMS